MRWFHLAIIILFTAVTFVFAIQNFQSAAVSFLSFSMQLPLAILIGIIYAIGAATGGSLLALLRRSINGARQPANSE